jgi:hypothetical protein
MKPKHDRKRWLESAPEYVTACRDAGPKVNDRWTVFIGGSLSLTAKDSKDQPRFDGVEEYLGMNSDPTHPSFGISQWGETPRGNRKNSGKTIRWLDLPGRIRQHVIARCTQYETTTHPTR